MQDELLLLIISFTLLFVVGFYAYERETNKPKKQNSKTILSKFLRRRYDYLGNGWHTRRPWLCHRRQTYWACMAKDFDLHK